MVLRPILLDTNAYSAFKLGQPKIIEIIQYAELIAISPIMLGEMLAGFDLGNKSKQNRSQLQTFLDTSRCKIYPVTSDTSHFYSNIILLLKRKGRPIPTNDIWIAAQALEYGCTVCTFDKHFSEIEGLVVGTTLAELAVG